jgi:hypothetical protein
MTRLSGKNIEVPLQNVHVPVTVGNIVTFSYFYTPHSKREPCSDRVSVHRIRHDVDWFNNTNYISVEKGMLFLFLFTFD